MFSYLIVHRYSGKTDCFPSFLPSLPSFCPSFHPSVSSLLFSPPLSYFPFFSSPLPSPHLSSCPSPPLLSAPATHSGQISQQEQSESERILQSLQVSLNWRKDGFLHASTSWSVTPPSVYQHVCSCAHTGTDPHAHTHVHTHMYMCACVHTETHTNIYKHVRAHLCEPTCTYTCA